MTCNGGRHRALQIENLTAVPADVGRSSQEKLVARSVARDIEFLPYWQVSHLQHDASTDAAIIH